MGKKTIGNKELEHIIHTENMREFWQNKRLFVIAPHSRQTHEFAKLLLVPKNQVIHVNEIHKLKGLYPRYPVFTIGFGHRYRDDFINKVDELHRQGIIRFCDVNNRLLDLAQNATESKDRVKHKQELWKRIRDAWIGDS